VSVGLAVSAGVLFRTYAAGSDLSRADIGPTIPVVAAGEAIGRGQPLRVEQLRVMPWPMSLAPPGSFQDPSKIAGRVALADLAAGEAVTETRLARVRAGPVASLIPEGLRAFAVPTSLPPGAISPGDHVDILATYAGTQAAARTEVVVTAAAVLVILGPGSGGAPTSSLGAGLDETARSPAAPTLIILVTPEQQQRLAFARSFANLEVTIDPA
jgi:Flp pilus assembly protein CpaB